MSKLFEIIIRPYKIKTSEDPLLDIVGLPEAEIRERNEETRLLKILIEKGRKC